MADKLAQKIQKLHLDDLQIKALEENSVLNKEEQNKLENLKKTFNSERPELTDSLKKFLNKNKKKRTKKQKELVNEIISQDDIYDNGLAKKLINSFLDSIKGGKKTKRKKAKRNKTKRKKGKK
tara:strand:- start:87 stop:455 length:369 start_codon:yes stop_codon:yes gene_type:complete